jgi:hypothetical protein
MITTAIFETLLLKSESSNIDFKLQQYDFKNDIDKSKTAKFIKDIISFCNTIRTEPAYIIIGIEINKDGSKKLVGLNENIDDSIFQEKLMNKVSPNPTFSSYSFSYSELNFGIIEIPIKKYSEPISPTVKMKGLEPGRIYFRRGSSNSEANGREVITISKWLESLPDIISENSLSTEIPQLISKITSRKYPLSECIADVLQFAEKFNLPRLKEFCKNELSGWHNKLSEEEVPKQLSYRVSEVLISPYEIEINPYSGLSSTGLLNEMKKTEGFYPQRFLFPQPISDLETYIKRLNDNPNTIMTLKTSANRIFTDKKFHDLKVTMYANRDNIENIYNGIRQKLIDNLLEIN